MPLKTKSSVHSVKVAFKYHPDRNKMSLMLRRDSRKYLRLMPFSQTRGRGNNMMHKALKVLRQQYKQEDIFNRGTFRDVFSEFGFNADDSLKPNLCRRFYLSTESTRGPVCRCRSSRLRPIITLDQAAFGTEFEVTLPRLKRCSNCNRVGC